MARSGLCLLVPIVALALYQLTAGEYLGDGSGMDVTNLSNATIDIDNVSNSNISGSLVPEGAVSTCCIILALPFGYNACVTDLEQHCRHCD